MRLLTICLPMIGGRNRVVLSLRPSFQPYGVHLRWLAAGYLIGLATSLPLALCHIPKRASTRLAQQ